MRRWFGRQFGTPWVRVLALCFACFIVGMAVQALQDEQTQAICRYCEKPLSGADPICAHEKCFEEALQLAVEGSIVGAQGPEADYARERTADGDQDAGG